MPAADWLDASTLDVQQSRLAALRDELAATVDVAALRAAAPRTAAARHAALAARLQQSRDRLAAATEVCREEEQALARSEERVAMLERRRAALARAATFAAAVEGGRLADAAEAAYGESEKRGIVERHVTDVLATAIDISRDAIRVTSKAEDALRALQVLGNGRPEKLRAGALAVVRRALAPEAHVSVVRSSKKGGQCTLEVKPGGGVAAAAAVEARVADAARRLQDVVDSLPELLVAPHEAAEMAISLCFEPWMPVRRADLDAYRQLVAAATPLAASFCDEMSSVHARRRRRNVLDGARAALMAIQAAQVVQVGDEGLQSEDLIASRNPDKVVLDHGLLAFPRCTVSEAVKAFVDFVEREAVADGDARGSGRADDAADDGEVADDAISAGKLDLLDSCVELFRAVYPLVSSSRSIPSAVFHNDCLFVAHFCQRHLRMAVHSDLRSTAVARVSAQVQKEQEAIDLVLDNVESFMDAEAVQQAAQAIGARLRQLAADWVDVLPHDVALVAVNSLTKRARDLVAARMIDEVDEIGADECDVYADGLGALPEVVEKKRAKGKEEAAPAADKTAELVLILRMPLAKIGEYAWSALSNEELTQLVQAIFSHSSTRQQVLAALVM